jgi:hypothetical protein
MPWDEQRAKYEIREARLVAAIEDGGVVIENRDVLYEEGRFGRQYDDDVTLASPIDLTQQYLISTLDHSEGDASTMTTARIVINGRIGHQNIEVRGDGWFGYDENGYFTGSFDEAPQILVDREAGDPDELIEETSSMRGLGPKPRHPRQFERATRARPPQDDE